MSGLAIAARGLGRRFGPRVALAGIDLEVPSASVLCVAGPNGAGKSTLLRILAGLLAPSEGTLALGSEGLDRRRARRLVGYVGHATFLYPELSALENLLFAARLHGLPERERRARARLDEVGLSGVADQPARGFSRGMAQRLAIARALVHEPEVVLLDEPFSGLDAPSAERLAARIEALRADGRTVVMATHDLDRAAALGDASLILVRGRPAWGSRERRDAPALRDAYDVALRATP
ncbi:MAG: heme ABC exporter ATP-binding protein CcmA [Myxococcota bacterium]|nr:heme ABC exporter ATP-binding protein CcmA [Myxococcota bacterium]